MKIKSCVLVLLILPGMVFATNKQENGEKRKFDSAFDSDSKEKSNKKRILLKKEEPKKCGEFLFLLPPDCWTLITKFLYAEDWLNLRLVSKNFQPYFYSLEPGKRPAICFPALRLAANTNEEALINFIKKIQRVFLVASVLPDNFVKQTGVFWEKVNLEPCHKVSLDGLDRIVECCPNLKKIKIDELDLPKAGDSSEVTTTSFQNLLNKCPKLKTIAFLAGHSKIDFNKIDYSKNPKLKRLEGITHLSPAGIKKLAACSNLTTLGMRKLNDVSEDKDSGWSSFKKLTTLKIGGGEDSILLAQSFKKLLENSPLKTFQFDGNFSGKFGDMAGKGIPLKTLDLEASNITSQQFISLLKRCSTSLEVLSIDHCEKLHKDEVLDQINWEELSNLQDLSLGDYYYSTRIDSTGWITELIDACPKIRRIYFGSNPYGLQGEYKGKASIAELRRYLNEEEG